MFGKASGFASSYFDFALFPGDGFVLNNAQAGSRSGTGVSAGDVNGDGIDDIIIGARDYDAGFLSNTGGAYVVFGPSTGGTNVDLSTLNGTNGFVIEGHIAGERAGSTVASAGDVNGDGYDDIMVGRYVVFGQVSGFAATLSRRHSTARTASRSSAQAREPRRVTSTATASTTCSSDSEGP